MRRLAVGAVALLALGSGCTRDLDADPVASPSSTPSSTVPEGTVFALITASDGVTVTWDELDHQGADCAAELSEADTYERQFAACYRNPDATLRTAPLDPAAKVVVHPPGDPKRTVLTSQLGAEIDAGDIPRQYRAWKVAVRGGRVVAIEQAR